MNTKKMALLYDRILRHRRVKVNKSDTAWNWSFNTPCKSLKGILVLFEGEKPYARDTGKFYNPKIQKVSVTVEGKPNQLYAQGMRSFEQYDEIYKFSLKERTLMKFRNISRLAETGIWAANLMSPWIPRPQTLGSASNDR